MHSQDNKNIEIERKYVIKLPDITLISKQMEYTKSDIIQIYLKSKCGQTRRIRKRGFFDRVEYYETTKIRIDEMSSTEIEKEINEEQYNILSKQILSDSSPIHKTRHTFVYEGQLFEIDVYPEWKNSAIMETELANRSDIVSFPSFLEIIKEVTGDKKYSNASMSRQFPEEII